MTQWSGFVPRVRETTSQQEDTKEREQKKIIEAAEAEEFVVQSLLKNGCDDLIAGLPGLIIEDKKVKSILNLIDDKYAGNARRYAVNFFVKGLEQGKNELAWQVRLPSRVIALRMPSPPISADLFGLLNHADLLRSMFMARWRQSDAAKIVIEPCDVVLSAVALSAVLNEKQLLGLLQNLHIGTRHYQGLTWVEWQDDKERWSRVVLDSVTASLLRRWLQAHPEPEPFLPEVNRKTIFKELTHYLPLAMFEITNFAQFLDIFRSYWAIALPPFLYQWCIGRLPSAVLPAKTWFRLLSRQRHTSTQLVAQDENAVGLSKMNRSRLGALAEETQSGVQDKKIKSLRPLLLSTSNKVVIPSEAIRRLKIARHQYAVNSLNDLLVGWLIWVLTPKSKGGKGVKVSSASTQLCRIDRLLLHFLAGQSPLDMPNDWSVRLQALTESQSDRNRGNVIGALKSFQAYLERYHQMPLLDIDLGDSGESRVDANLLSEQEFRLVCQLLAIKERSSGVALQVATILARRAGLRREEARCLRLSDWIGVVSPQLIIRPNVFRSLKAPSSRRQIALAPLCTSSELQLLNHYVSTLKKQADLSGMRYQNHAFFPTPNRPNEPISEHPLCDPIETAMREVTGDATLRFHHLRHSAVNLNLLHSLEGALDGANRFLLEPKNELAPSEMVASQHVRQSLLGASEMIRPRLWSVASAAGHASPETTMGSYFHLCDWLRYHSVQKDLSIDDQLLAGVEGLTLSNLRVIRHRKTAKIGGIYGVRPVISYWDKKYQPQGSYQALDSFGTMIDYAAIQNQSEQPLTVTTLDILNTLSELIAPRPLLKPAQLQADNNQRTPSKSKTRHRLPVEQRQIHIEKVAAQFKIQPTLLLSWWRAVERMEMLQGIGPANTVLRAHLPNQCDVIQIGELALQRPIRLPEQIRRRADHRHAMTLDQLLHRIAVENPQQLQLFLTSFWRCRSADLPELNVGSVTDAQQLHAVLSQLSTMPDANISFLNEQKACQIRYGLRPSPNSLTGDAQAQQKFWADALALPLEAICLQPPMGQARHAEKPNGAFVIYLYFQPKAKSESQGKRSPSDAVRTKQYSGTLISAAYVATLWQILPLF